jgi:hypothetical protein
MQERVTVPTHANAVRIAVWAALGDLAPAGATTPRAHLSFMTEQDRPATLDDLRVLSWEIGEDRLGPTANVERLARAQ